MLSRLVRPLGTGFMFKLYVGTSAEALPIALRHTCEAAAHIGVPCVKVASDTHALARPDKLVAYVADSDQRDRLAERLHCSLAGLPPHPVPFTAPLADDGLVSWAADPPRDSSEGRRSWREHVCLLLAEGLHRARAAGIVTADAMIAARAWALIGGVDPLGWYPLALSTSGSRH
ncbi:T3SS effector HopA1 family protein [Rhizobium rhizogenes]|uniref:T3SS effector HopA1 family protein n=1 Tax=Rhizobium rhizogenes TaxID=359 RepID=UPI001295037C|nr:T3SS effector HopA1 family protein [Rhizobium rhizogenes]